MTEPRMLLTIDGPAESVEWSTFVESCRSKPGSSLNAITKLEVRCNMGEGGIADWRISKICVTTEGKPAIMVGHPFEKFHGTRYDFIKYLEGIQAKSGAWMNGWQMALRAI